MTPRTDSNKQILLITLIFCVCHRGITRSLVSLIQEDSPYVVGDTITLRCTFAVSPPLTTIATARLDTSVTGSYVTIYKYNAASNVTTITADYRQGNITGRLDPDGKSYLFMLHNSQLSDTGSYRCAGVLSDGSRPRRAAVTAVVVNQITEIEVCLSNPCQNSGTCVSNVNNYTCTCAGCFTGINCEKAITNLCNSNPCKNGGTCHGNCTSYSCTCPTGTAGTNCQIERRFPWWLILVIVLVIIVILSILIALLTYYWKSIKKCKQPNKNRVGADSGNTLKYIVPYDSRYTITTASTSRSDSPEEVKMTLTYLPETNRYRALQPLDVEAERRKLRKQRVKIPHVEEAC